MSDPEASTGSCRIRGTPASPGVGIATATVVQRQGLSLPEYRIREEEVPAEVERLRGAIARTREHLERLRQPLADLELVDAIFRTQIMILEDRQLFSDSVARIQRERINAEWAVGQELERLNRLFDGMEDAYLRERRTDVNFAIRQLLLMLLGRQSDAIGGISGPTVIVADDLSAAEVAQLDRVQVAALATEAGGPTSHTSIMANSLGIPAVVGLPRVGTQVRDGDLVIVDGRRGLLLARPAPEVVAEYRERARLEAERARTLLRVVDLPSETRDGRRVALRANIERSDEVLVTRQHGAGGVGLFRTEFLYMNRAGLPDEEEQYRHYRSVVEGVAPHPAAIRTVDLGSDKLPLPAPRRGEANPALGLRGVRLARLDARIVGTQLRALLRASAHGSLRILLPLVTGVEEVRAVRACLVERRAELEREGRLLADSVELGVVVETPAAVAMVDLLASEVDFFSIGTNDLIQYTIAVDRENEHVAYLYDPLHPAVLRSIRAVVEGAHARGKSVGICGEMAGDARYSIVLLGLGVDELSMNAPAIPRVKRILRETRYADARLLASELLGQPTAAEVADRLRKELQRRFPDEFEGA